MRAKVCLGLFLWCGGIDLVGRSHAEPSSPCSVFQFPGDHEFDFDVGLFPLDLNYDESIESPTEVFRWVSVIADWMKIELDLKVSKPVEIRVCRNMESENASPTLGAFVNSASGGVMTLRYGLTGRRLLQVAAHEWVHVWQSENCPEDQRLLIHEGFAQWGAVELLKRLALSEDIETLRNREDFYGDAYRWVAEFEENEGRRALIEYVRTER